MRNLTASTRFVKAGSAYISGTLCFFALAGFGQVRADVNAFTLRQPLNNATVRETVPIRVPRNLLSQAGYASITIDGQFRGAQAIPDRGDVVYQWDTKHVADSSGAGNGDQQESPDGKHVVQVSLFDKDSNEIASASSTVRVLNRITTLPDGVRLVYKWRQDEVATYRLHSVLKSGNSNGSAPDSSSSSTEAAAPAIQDVYARLQRSVEDVSGAGILVRDQYVGGTYGSAQLTSAFTLSSKYTTVNSSGSILVQNQPLGAGRHYGYGFDEFPDRRVNAGDSWQTQMMISLPWAVEKMTSVRGQARLDEFEWENGYPTAKVVETYTGPAAFRLDSSDQSSSMGDSAGRELGGASSGSDNRVEASNVTVKRTIWFAYEAGAVVREETTLTVDSSGLSGALSSLTAPSGSGAAQGGMGMGAPEGRPGYGRPMGEPGNSSGYPGQQASPDGSSINAAPTVNANQTNLESDKLLTLLSLG